MCPICKIIAFQVSYERMLLLTTQDQNTLSVFIISILALFQPFFGSIDQLTNMFMYR